MGRARLSKPWKRRPAAFWVRAVGARPSHRESSARKTHVFLQRRPTRPTGCFLLGPAPSMRAIQTRRLSSACPGVWKFHKNREKPDENPPNQSEERASLTALPENLTALPENLTALPENLTALPENLTALSENLTALPRNLTALPRNLTALPMKLTALPEKLTAFFKKPTAFHASLTDLPENQSALTVNPTGLPMESAGIARESRKRKLPGMNGTQ